MHDEVGILRLLGDSASAQRLAAGDVLFRKGDAGDTMFVVKLGELRIDDERAALEIAGIGAIVGEMAIIEKAVRAATVTAVTDAEVIGIDQRQFLEMVRQTPYFAIRVMRVISARLRAMNERLAAA